MLYMSDLSNGQKDPHFKPSTGASINPAQNIQMLSIIKDIRGAGLLQFIIGRLCLIVFCISVILKNAILRDIYLRHVQEVLFNCK